MKNKEGDKMPLDDELEDDFKKRIDQFGLESLDRFVLYMPNPSKNMIRGITYAHRDFESVVSNIAQGKDFVVISGLNPSGPLHLGHKAIFDELLWLQQLGAEIYIPITNDETYVVGKSKSLAEARKCAYESVIPSIISFGFDPKRTHIFLDSDYKDIYNVAFDLSKHMSYSTIKAIFGEDTVSNPGIMFYRSCVQLAQIFLPQLTEFGGPKPTIIPVGIDQDPYILLARDIAKKKGFVPPSALYLKFLMGLDGTDKMSASRPNSCIYLTDNENDAKRKVLNAFTGGQPSIEEQSKYGGKPEACPIYAMYKFHFADNAELEDLCKNCKSGKRYCGECKEELLKKVVSYLKQHQEQMKESKKHIDEFLLKTQINSILEY